MKLGKHISDLLYHHESVIVPGLGTFSTRYVPARFIPEKKIVESPAKRATFSPDPKEGPTPLPDYMAQKEGKPVGEIREFLRDVVQEIRQSLEKGKSIELEQLGRLTRDEKGTILFAPDLSVNFLEDAPGVAAVSTPPQKDSGEKPSVAPEKEPSTDTPNSEYEYAELSKKTKPHTTEPMEEKRSTLPPVLKWIAIILVPLLLIALLLYLSFNLLVKDGRFFWQPAPPVVEMVEEDRVEPDETEVPVVDPAEVEEVTEDLPVHEETLTDPLRPEPGRTVYYLVVGSFRNEVKAEQLAENLRKAGAERAHVLPRTPSRYHRVCYGFYYDLREAERQKAALDQDLRQVAWILHR